MWKHKARFIQGKNFMTTKTKDLLQKVCYKKTASIDMTNAGFISDSKVHPVKLLMKPLKEQLEILWGNYAHTKEVNNVLPKLKQQKKEQSENNEKKTLKTPKKRFQGRKPSKKKSASIKRKIGTGNKSRVTAPKK